VLFEQAKRDHIMSKHQARTSKHYELSAMPEMLEPGWEDPKKLYPIPATVHHYSPQEVPAEPPPPSSALNAPSLPPSRGASGKKGPSKKAQALSARRMRAACLVEPSHQTATMNKLIDACGQHGLFSEKPTRPPPVIVTVDSDAPHPPPSRSRMGSPRKGRVAMEAEKVQEVVARACAFHDTPPSPPSPRRLPMGPIRSIAQVCVIIVLK
jgi:hypothetical protein